MIKNPIIKGFNPDPSICRVGDDYYLAVSTFEWFPGVLIYHSNDLENWEIISRPLNRVSQLDMKGNGDSGGIFAPALSYSDGLFWLVYTDVKGIEGDVWKDGNNFLVTCDTIDGEWSDPIYLNASGFDPSLYHDTDGRKYLVNMVWDHREHNHRFYGISLHEYSHEERKLIGEHKIIFKGTELGLTEAPHLYKVNNYYYLITAEGGTSYAHAVTVCRSKDISGPYVVHPSNPILTSWNNPDLVLQKAGHCSFVETPLGEWYLVHLSSRPLRRRGKKITEEIGFCSLGRETSIQKMYWENDWPYVVNGPNPSEYVDKPRISKKYENIEKIASDVDNFRDNKLGNKFQTLRIPFTDHIGYLDDARGLVLKGRESLHSKFTQSHVARRWESMNFEAETKLLFEPDTFQQEAGLVAFYNTKNWVSIHITRNEEVGKILNITASDNYKISMPIYKDLIKLPDKKPVYLKIIVDLHDIKFEYSVDNVIWNNIDYISESFKLSDDYGNYGNLSNAAFTGAFIGMYCIDSLGTGKEANFDYFKYTE